MSRWRQIIWVWRVLVNGSLAFELTLISFLKLLFVSSFRHRSELYTTSWMTAETTGVILEAVKRAKGPERKGYAADVYKRNGKIISPVWSPGHDYADRNACGRAYLCTLLSDEFWAAPATRYLRILQPDRRQFLSGATHLNRRKRRAVLTPSGIKILSWYCKRPWQMPWPSLLWDDCINREPAH